MPTYEYLCEKCELVFDMVVCIEERNNPQICTCGGESRKVMLTPPQTRTEKTSRTFLDGMRNDGYNEEVKAASLDAEAMNHNPRSDKYKELKAEAATRRLLNNNPEKRGKRYRLNTDKKPQEKKT